MHAAVDEWTQGKPFIVALAAPWVATSVQGLCSAFEQHTEWRISTPKLPEADPAIWYKLYRSHRSTFAVLFEIYSSVVGEKIASAGFLAYQVLIRRAFRKMFIACRPDHRTTSLALKLATRIVLISNKFLHHIVTGNTTNQKTKERLKNQVSTNIEFAFFIKVTAPCWVLYGVPPVKLYWSACHDNKDAIENLLRLDRHMVHEPRIGKAIMRLRSNLSSHTHDKLLSAALKKPDVRISSKSIKYSMGGLISALSELYGQHLTAPQIRGLFNAILKDSDPIKYRHERPEDPDLIENDDSFYRRIKQNQDLWLKMFTPDKTKFSNVRVRNQMK